MPLRFALLLSIALHAAVIAGPVWRMAGLRSSPAAAIEAQLVPLAPPATLAEAVSTESASAAEALSRTLAAPARAMQGSALRRARTALSEHLFYPPEAVARGLEGDVILLLTLADNGQLVSASIARSSGHGLLDQAALDAARRVGALPGNPRQTLFPVSFRLQ